MRKVALALGALSLVACSKGFGSGFEGSITLRSTRGSSPPVDMVVKAKGDKLRFETPTSDGRAAIAIYSPTDNKVTVLVDAQKIAMDMDLSSPSAAPNTSADTSNVDKTGKSETIAGIGCEDYVVKDPSGRRTETCIAQGLAFFDLEGVRRGVGGSAWTKSLREKKMFPLKSVEYDAAGKEISRTEAVTVQKEKLDDAMFVVPADYKRMTQPRMH
jgi:hypothetical protein